MKRRLVYLPKNSNLIIMAWKTSDFLVLNEPKVTVLLSKVINIIDMKKKWQLLFYIYSTDYGHLIRFFSKMGNDYVP